MSYHQLTQQERYQIQAGIDLGFSVSTIAIRLKRHRSTIFRELRRNGHISKEGYSAIHSQHQYETRRSRCRRKFVIRSALKLWIDQRLKLQWSPEQIAGRRRLENRSLVGVETIYRYLWRNKLVGGTLWHNLRHSSGRKRRRFKRHRWPTATPRLSAEQRPPVILNRSRQGDFERDLIVGKNHASHLMTLVDRKTKLVRLRKIKKKTADVIHRETLAALEGIDVQSITNDNGCEFINHRQTSDTLNIPIFFTRPYAAWERGTVENTNKLVRQYFPKKSNLQEASNEKIKMVETLLNHRPRKLLGFRTPLETSA